MIPGLRKKHWFAYIIVCCCFMAVAGCPNKDNGEDTPEGAQRAGGGNEAVAPGTSASGTSQMPSDPFDVKPSALPTEAELNALGPIREENRELLRFMPDNPSSFLVVNPARLIQTPLFLNGTEFVEALIPRLMTEFRLIPFFPVDRQLPFSNIKRMTFCTTPTKQKPEVDPMTGWIKPPLPINTPACVCVLELNAPVDDLLLLALFNIYGNVAVETLAPVMVGNMRTYDMFPPTEEKPVWVRLVIVNPTTVVYASGSVSDVAGVFDSEPGKGAIPSRVLRTDMQNGDFIALYSTEGVPFGFTDMIMPYMTGRDLILQMQGRQSQMEQDEEEIMQFINTVKGMALRIDLQSAVGGNLMQVDMDFQKQADATEWETGMKKSITASLTAMKVSAEQNKSQAGNVPPENAQDFETAMKAASFQISTVEGLSVSASGHKIQLALKKAAGFDQNFSELLAPVFVQSRQAQQAGLDHDSLRVIALGISRYLETNEMRFPHYAIFGENGAPLLSWRVAILPALGELELYNQFHFNEPWDSVHNRTLIEKMPKIFADPSGQAPVGKTIFRMFGGDGSILGRFPNGFTMSDLAFPPEALYLLAVVPDQAVEWTKPEFVQYQPETFAQMVRPMFAALSCICEVAMIQVDAPNVAANFQYWISGTISQDRADILRARQQVEQMRQQQMLQQQITPQNPLPQPPPVPPMGNPPMQMPPVGQ